MITLGLAQSLRFSIPGEPVSKERPRHGNGHTFTPKKTKDAEEVVRARFRLAYPDWRTNEDEAQGFRIGARFLLRGYAKRDVDNMLKLVMDALNGVVWGDDVQVSEISRVIVRCGCPVASTEVVIFGAEPRGAKPEPLPAVSVAVREAHKLLDFEDRGGSYIAHCYCGASYGPDSKTSCKEWHRGHRSVMAVQLIADREQDLFLYNSARDALV